LGLGADVSSIDDIILTHLHGDHSNGLESFGFARAIARLNGSPRPRPRLHAARAVLDRVWQKLAPAMDGPMARAAGSTLEDFFEPRELPPDAEAEIAGLRVRRRPTGHSIPTIGLLIADGVRTPSLGKITFPLVREYVSDMQTVSEEQIKKAVRYLFFRLKLVVEPAGALGLAALLSGAVRATGRVGVVISGGNVDASLMSEILLGTS